jgi:hypothetical protein
MIALQPAPLLGPWIQTASRRAFDLVAPRAELVDFEIDVPEHLARIARFGGAIRGGVYSVAQHCVLGADLAFDHTRNEEFAAAFLLHDAHEAYIGDIATPVAQALAAFAFDRFGDGTPVSGAIRLMKHQIDTAIHARAGIRFPLSPPVSQFVKEWDRRMLVTERNLLLGGAARPWHEDFESAEPLPIRGGIKIWPWPVAADAYRARLARWCPAALPDAL